MSIETVPPTSSISVPKSILSIVIIWLVSGLMLGVGLAFLKVPTLFHITSHQSSTTGEIERTFCEQHNGIAYDFTVNSKLYFGGDIKDRCTELQPGQEITVYFNALDPKENTSGDPKAKLLNELMAIGLGVLVFPPLIIWRLFVPWRKKSAPISGQTVDLGRFVR
jgi:hypothetical protein